MRRRLTFPQWVRSYEPDSVKWILVTQHAANNVNNSGRLLQVSSKVWSLCISFFSNFFKSLIQRTVTRSSEYLHMQARHLKHFAIQRGGKLARANSRVVSFDVECFRGVGYGTLGLINIIFSNGNFGNKKEMRSFYLIWKLYLPSITIPHIQNLFSDRTTGMLFSL